MAPNGVFIHLLNEGIYNGLDLDMGDGEFPEDKIKGALDLAMSESGKPMTEVLRSLVLSSEFNWRKK